MPHHRSHVHLTSSLSPPSNQTTNIKYSKYYSFRKKSLFIRKINMSNSECESGWTMYFDQSQNSWSYMGVKQHGEEEDDDDDGDLSMVSDASSGPRQKFAEDDQEKVYGERKKGRSKKEKKFNDVDDTVSSPVFTSTSKNKSGLLKKAPSVGEKCASNKQGADNEVTMKKGRECGTQGSRELGSTNVIARQLNLKY
ncbi:uncharacterized protein LOC111879663 isoform X2 [Lactuca sativa]|uniref:Uncharacterized protein n=1 Tax=Lactuca sativa TaxID=4236 RepID=A0A9R1X946_LACSA|nr:uncharacterized protein LOC111879663 isoform X2 [Lactuca sativa]KAJ0202039.1 hypothetical protein LSAT_V11C600338960 [Lactuca sativa]